MAHDWRRTDDFRAANVLEQTDTSSALRPPPSLPKAWADAAAARDEKQRSPLVINI